MFRYTLSYLPYVLTALSTVAFKLAVSPSPRNPSITQEQCTRYLEPGRWR
jgi:hypothetical protein